MAPATEKMKRSCPYSGCNKKGPASMRALFMHNRPLALTFNGVIVPILSRPIGAIFADDYNVGLSSRSA